MTKARALTVAGGAMGESGVGVSGDGGPSVKFEKGSVGVDIAERYVNNAD